MTDNTGPAPVARASGPFELRSEPLRVTLESIDTSREPLAARLLRLASGQRIVLMVNTLSADAPPGTRFYVYLNLPKTITAPTPNDPRLVGEFAYFGEVRTPDGLPPSTYRRFDITSLLRQLHEDGQATGPVTVTIAAARAVSEGAKPTIGDITVLVQ
jgi:hypothetical protein